MAHMSDEGCYCFRENNKYVMKKRRCPSEECNHGEYIDYSERTMTPQPMCPACMKVLIVPAPYEDGSGDEVEEVY